MDLVAIKDILQKLDDMGLGDYAYDLEKLVKDYERLLTGNRLHLELAEIQNAEIERLREKYEKLLGASVAFQIAIQNAMFVFERTVDDIQQKESK